MDRLCAERNGKCRACLYASSRVKKRYDNRDIKGMYYVEGSDVLAIQRR